jgi:hypothetical protein
METISNLREIERSYGFERKSPQESIPVETPEIDSTSSEILASEVAIESLSTFVDTEQHAV